MMARNVVLVALSIALAGSGCARKVVLDPEAAQLRNSPDWTVKAEPRKAPEKR